MKQAGLFKGPDKKRRAVNAVYPSEHDEQASLMQWAEWYPDLRDHLFAIPNGGDRDPRVGARLKAEGVKPGVHDLMLPIARRGYHGLWIEMKSRDPRAKLSNDQKIWGARMACQGYHTVVTAGWEAAVSVIHWYMETTEQL